MARKSTSTLSHPNGPPQKQALLLTCMDLRLTDDTTRFMNGFNMQNRYDHLAFAGAAMGARLLATTDKSNSIPWKRVFFHHLDIAIEGLGREIKDIIILEHLDCGAYKYLHPDDKPNGVREKYKAFSENDNMKKQIPFHRKESLGFAREIDSYFKHKYQETEKLLRPVKAKVLAGKGNEDDYQAVLSLEKKMKGWSEVHIRCFVMDLNGCVERL